MATAEKLTGDIEKFTAGVNKLTQEPLGDVEEELNSVFAGALIDNVTESFYYENSISNFLNEEKIADDLENSLKKFQNTLDKASDVVSDIKKGTTVNIEKYVDGAIKKFKNFDSLFEKWKIVKAAAINILATKCGGKAEEYIKEFEDLFHKELYRQFGIEEDEHYIPSKKDKIAAGSKSQG